MDKLDMNLLSRIENIFELKFCEWQINYLLDIPMILDIEMTGRQTGKTFVYIIKLLFEDETPVIANEKIDWWSSPRNGSYERWFCDFLKDIYFRLTSNGVIPRKVIYIDPKNNNRFSNVTIPILRYK